MRSSRKRRGAVEEAVKIFFISTTFIGIMSGVIGCVFFPEERVGMNIYFSPPVFGFISAVLSFLFNLGSEREMSNGRIAVQEIGLLCAIEAAVFGLNYISGNSFSPLVSVILAVGIAVIYVLVHLTVYFADRHRADDFNRLLEDFKRTEPDN